MRAIFLFLAFVAAAASGVITLDESGGEYASDLAFYTEPETIRDAETARLVLIELNRVPESKPSGRGWDVMTGPDLELRLLTGDGFEFATSDGPLLSNVEANDLPVSFAVDGREVSVDETFVLRVFDHDRTGEDLMFRSERFAAAEAQSEGVVATPIRTWTGHEVGTAYFAFADL